MRAMRAEQFSGYEGLKLVDLPKPAVTDGKVLVRIAAAGVTPLDHTILSGKFHHSKAPLVLGNEGAAWGRREAQVALTRAGFRADKTVLAPAIGGSIGNAVTQLARALGAKHAMSSTTNHAKAEQAKALGFNEVIDTSLEKLGDGVRRITDGYGADIVVDGIGGEVLSEAPHVLASGGTLPPRGYSESRKTTIDVTDLIVPQASIRSLNMFRQPQATVA